MRIVVLNPSDFRHWTLYVKGCGPWTDTTTPRTDRPVRFRRVALRKRDAWGLGWDHFSKSETFRFGY